MTSPWTGPNPRRSKDSGSRTIAARTRTTPSTCGWCPGKWRNKPFHSRLRLSACPTALSRKRLPWSGSLLQKPTRKEHDDSHERQRERVLELYLAGHVAGDGDRQDDQPGKLQHAPHFV